MAWRLGVDSGGTFTDVCLFNDRTGASHVWKLSSTPEDPSVGIADGIAQALERAGADPRDVSFLGHGTTVATNALIQLRGVPTGLITTDGFRDLLEIGRQKRPHLYDTQAVKPVVLVPRVLRKGVVERLRHDGSVDLALDEDGLRAAARDLAEEGVQSVAVCFLYSYRNPGHERRALDILREALPGVFICTSSDVAPEFREFERMSTVVVNAYLGPVMQRYIRRLYDRIKSLGITVEPKLTQSNGGIISFDMAASLPVRTILSGPTTGVVAAQAISRKAGFPNVITFDVGGTSSDVALLTDGQCAQANQADAGGYPIKAPMLDIHAVGAGGGSIAYVDNGGLLKVGPRSAGADPGPACYGKGNDEPTVTDANIVLGTLNTTTLLGGRLTVRKDLAEAAIQRLADKLGLSLMEAAHGIIAVATANMAKAIRVISVQRGHDPRGYALFAFGGAGPLHAARLARELDMQRIIIPKTPGILCAMGLLLTDLRTDFMQTQFQELRPEAVPAIRDTFGKLAGEASAWFEGERVGADARVVEMTVDMRYAGQNYELSVPVRQADADAALLRGLVDGFEQAHQRQYGFVVPEGKIELVTCRLAAIGKTPKIALPDIEPTREDIAGAIIGRRDVWFSEQKSWMTCPVYARASLRSGHAFQGPAIVEQMDATTLVLPGMRANVDAQENIILEFQ
ncbi:Methylhydantoinase [Bordetella sputigena]|uniref:hydantoinase/oxoprolinase family protein n=1 Tax=Bordetella sputigena TaxID=1416810 RepID=UPI0039EF2709